jgi:sigma-B regulation protein RsbU (phosphoserine phosphatase)
MKNVPPIKLLLIDDSPQDGQLLGDLLRKAADAAFELETADRVSTALACLAREKFDLILLDLSLPDSTGLETVKTMRARVPKTPIIVLSGLADETVAVNAVHEGAQDYLVKGQVNSPLLVRAIRYAIERQRAELAVIQAEGKYRSIFENTIEGIFLTTPDGHYLNANPALARIYGYDSPEELMNSITDIARKLYVEPGRRDEFVRLMQEHNTVSGFESRVFRKDGSIIWISENVRAVRGEQASLLYYEGTVEDITERRRTEEELRNSEALYHSLVENLPQNIFRKDLSERFTFANQRFCATLGRSLDEIVGKTDFDFFPGELAAKYQRDDHRIIETGQPFETVEEHQAPAGPKIQVQVVKTPLYDAKGRIIGLQGIFWDITEKRQFEEREQRAKAELARSREELRRKNQQMEEDLTMAREIQQAILPQTYPTFPRSAGAQQSALRFFHRYQPTGAVGGDFFNVLALSDTKAGVFICDVMGHGVRSALVTAMVRAMVEELKPVAGDPGQLLTQINRDLRAILRQTGTPLFTTAFYLVADVAAGQLRYANAGHPKPLLVHRETGHVESLVTNDKLGPPLGLFEESAYATSEMALKPNDLVLLFTDGLIEVEGANQTLFSYDLLKAAVERRVPLPAPQLFDELLAEIQRFSVNQEFADDVCLVAMEVARLEPGSG